MRVIRVRHVRPFLLLWVACSLLLGCASSNDGEVLDPAKSGLQGTWEYLVTNAFDARFINCTGDAVALEGATLYEGLSLAPICMVAVSFTAYQDGDAFQVPAHTVTCSDGASASASGMGQIHDPAVGGQWETTSESGVAAVQLFTGAISGNTIELSESRRTFSGTFEGSCDFSPALTAVVTVI